MKIYSILFTWPTQDFINHLRAITYYWAQWGPKHIDIITALSNSLGQLTTYYQKPIKEAPGNNDFFIWLWPTPALNTLTHSFPISFISVSQVSHDFSHVQIFEYAVVSAWNILLLLTWLTPLSDLTSASLPSERPSQVPLTDKCRSPIAPCRPQHSPLASHHLKCLSPLDPELQGRRDHPVVHTTISLEHNDIQSAFTE